MQENVLTTSVLSIGGGFVLNALWPSPFNLGLVLIGLGGIAYSILFTSKFDRLFKNLKLERGGAYPIIKDKEKTDVSTIYTYRLPAGLTEEDFIDNQAAIEQFLGKSVDIKYTHKAVQIEVFDSSPSETIPFIHPRCKGAVAFPVGYDKHNQLIFANLSKNEPHMLVCGETGSGKSVALRCLITYLILEKSADIYLIDYKMGAEFLVFEKISKVKGFAKTIAQGNRIISDLHSEVDRRYDLFAKSNCVNINEYNKKCPPLKPRILIVDEFAEMCDQKESIDLLQSLTAKARAAGVHIILSTQRPSADVINGRIKANCGTVIGLKTMNGLNSRVVFDKEGLEKLRGRGHGVLRHNGEETEFQGMYLSVEEAAELIKHTYTQKQDPPEGDFHVDL